VSGDDKRGAVDFSIEKGKPGTLPVFFEKTQQERRRRPPKKTKAMVGFFLTMANCIRSMVKPFSTHVSTTSSGINPLPK